MLFARGALCALSSKSVLSCKLPTCICYILLNVVLVFKDILGEVELDLVNVVGGVPY